MTLLPSEDDNRGSFHEELSKNRSNIWSEASHRSRDKS